MRSAIFTLIIFATSMICGAAAAQEPPAQQIAILLGNSDYDLSDNDNDGNAIDPMPTVVPGTTERHFPDLSSPCDDVNKIAKALDAYDFKIYKECDLTKSNLEEKLTFYKNIMRQAPSNSIVIFYYNGHGLQFNANLFVIPVKSTFDENKRQLDDSGRVEYLSKNNQRVSEMLTNFPIDGDKIVFFILDACRNFPFHSASRVDEDVTPDTPENMLTHYTSSAGTRTKDDGYYASLLATQLVTGGDIISIMTTVDKLAWREFQRPDSSRDNYIGRKIGHFVEERGYLPLRRKPVLAAAPPIKNGVVKASLAYQRSPNQFATLTVSSALPVRTASTVRASSAASAINEFASQAAPQPHPTRKKVEIFRNIYDGRTLDVFWCDNEFSERNYTAARRIAENVAKNAKQLGIGSVRLKLMSKEANAQDGYKIKRNVLRYDRNDREELTILQNIYVMEDSTQFLLSPGIGYGGKPSKNYVSAFLCGEDPRYYSH